MNNVEIVKHTVIKLANALKKSNIRNHKDSNVKHTELLNMLAIENGFKNWQAYKVSLENQDAQMADIKNHKNVVMGILSSIKYSELKSNLEYYEDIPESIKILMHGPSTEISSFEKITGIKELTTYNNHDVFRQMLPYKTEQLEDGRFIFVNRDYNPILLMMDKNKHQTQYVKYENYKKYSFTNNTETECYFYDDGNNPTLSEKDQSEYILRLNKYLETMQ